MCVCVCVHAEYRNYSPKYIRVCVCVCVCACVHVSVWEDNIPPSMWQKSQAESPETSGKWINSNSSRSLAWKSQGAK